MHVHILIHQRSSVLGMKCFVNDSWVGHVHSTLITVTGGKLNTRHGQIVCNVLFILYEYELQIYTETFLASVFGN